jgi:two-component system sensor histidine kinase/response regulator
MHTNLDNTKPLNRMLTVAEVAYALHVHPTTVRKWEKLGQLKSYRLGVRGNVRFKAEDISLFADSTSNLPIPVMTSSPKPNQRVTQPVQAKEIEAKPLEQIKPGKIPAPDDLSEPVKKALYQSEEKFTRIFAHSPVALSVTRLRDGVIMEINDSYTRFSGYTREEIIGQKVSEMNIWVNPADRESILNMLKDKGQVINEEFYLRNKSGKAHAVLVSAERINIEDEDCLLVMTIDISKRKKVDEALRESEEKFRNLFEHAKDAVILADADTGLLVDINPAACKMIGLPKDKIIGQHQTIIHPPEMAEKFKQVFREHVEKGLIDSDDTILQRADGTRIAASVSASVTKIGDKTFIQGVFRDISGRKRMEEALKDSEEKFSKAFNVSANAISITDLSNNQFIEINESYSRFTGYSREEVIGRTAAELKLWVMDEELKKLGNILEKEGKFRNMEFHSRMKSGEIRTGLASAELINIGGKACRIVVTTDITERKNAEEALRDSQEKYSKIFSTNANAIGITSNKTNLFIEANEAFTRFTGYSHDEVIGHAATELNLWVKQEELKRWMDTLKADGKVYNQEFSSRMKSGEIRIGLASAEIINIGGEPCRIISITDITERKRMEHELSDYRTHLEELVQKRTTELSTVNALLEDELDQRKLIQKELVQARDAAEEANRAKSDFLARMSHEIRTPIHGVIGTVNLLLDTELKEEQRQYGSMARASAESLLGIINDILDFSKIEAGQLVLEEMDFDLQATIEEAFQPMALAAHKKGTELTCRVAPGVPTVLVGDAGRLRQTIVNLLGNGVKFTEQGEVSASVAIESDSNDSIELHFVVRDTGIGIPPEKQSLLFNPFIQGNGSKYGGTGLGLVICRRLVGMMQGRIWLESQPGQGSAFHFTAKFKKSASAASSASVPPELGNFKGTPALVIDDNATTRLILTEILNNWGLTAAAAESKETALQELQKIKASSSCLPIVLLDITMATPNGLAIARQMGDDPLLKRRIIMMLPCDNISDDFARCQEAGIAAHMVKPIKKHELQKAILTVLSASGDDKKESEKPASSAMPELKLRILVAEDNPTSQLIARKTLEKMGCTVQIAGNGMEATRMAQQAGIDLVLMDFQMPEMDGLEATLIIREGEKQTHRHLPIIAMTANAMKADHDKCLSAGMDGYLTKPVSPDNLYKAIKGLLPTSKPEPEIKPAQEPAVDIEAAMLTVGGDKEILIEVLHVFQDEDSPRLLKSIKDGLQRQDGKTIKAEAHGMKGAVAALGGKTVAAMAARLEAAALNGDMTAAQTIFDEMCSELERFKEFYSKAELETKGGDR